MSKSDIKQAVLSQIKIFNRQGVSLVYMQRNIKANKQDVTDAVHALTESKKIKSKVTETGIKYFLCKD